jgi:hypothetical protein
MPPSSSARPTRCPTPRCATPRAWTGSPDNPSAASAVGAITRAIGAASAHGARGRTSHNPPVAGSSPTRPPATCRTDPDDQGIRRNRPAHRPGDPVLQDTQDRAVGTALRASSSPVFDVRNTAARLGHGGGGATSLRHNTDPVPEAGCGRLLPRAADRRIYSVISSALTWPYATAAGAQRGQE